MIEFLALGTAFDVHVERVTARLKSRGTTCELVDANSGTHISVVQSVKEGLRIAINGQLISKRCLIWNRLKMWTGSPFYFWPPEKLVLGSEEWRTADALSKEWQAFANLIGELYADQTVNNPATARRMNKVFQQFVANKVGLLTPPTLITNSKEEALQFLDSCNQGVIKSLSGLPCFAKVGESTLYSAFMTTPVTSADVRSAHASRFEGCPHLFQAAIEKSYELRIVAIADRLFAFSINSQDKPYSMTDWRWGSETLKFEKTDIPADIAAKIGRFLRYFDLFSGSFDFIVDKLGRYWFLECNEDGQWAWLDNLVDGEIAEGFAKAFEEKLSALQANDNEQEVTPAEAFGKLQLQREHNLASSPS